MLSVDINCDMGEGLNNEDQIMPFISSANIACGYHAGDEASILRVAQLSHHHGVKIGAHPSFPDRENFGRTEMHLTESELYEIVFLQLDKFKRILDQSGLKMQHVKPHGALYNQSAKDEKIAQTIARAVFDFDSTLILFGLSGSRSTQVAERLGLKVMQEVFADRTYRDDGTLTSRSHPNALITDNDKCIRQVMQFINEGTVTTVNKNTIPVKGDTICIHGDGSHAVAFAEMIYRSLNSDAGFTSKQDQT